MSGDQLDFLQGDRETLTGTLHDPAATTGHVLTVQADKSIKAKPGGGGSGGVVVRGPFAFAFNTPNLDAGVTVYTPTVGDLLLDAWIEVDTAFDGTTPKADIGTFDGAGDGLFNFGVGPVDLTSEDAEGAGAGILLGTPGTMALSNGSGNSGARVVPARFTAATDLLLVASQTGSNAGAAIDSTVGAARLYIVTATPVAF